MESRDTMEGEWYSRDFATAKLAGILPVSFEAEFEPNRSITREEMAVLLVCAYEYKVKTILDAQFNGVSDVTRVSNWALPQVNAAMKHGLLMGRGQGNFAPAATLNRAEAAQAIYNLLSKLQ